jgi:hypothetical protein
MNAGDTITFKPEYRDPGDETLIFIVVELLGEHRMKVAPIGTGMSITPTSVVRQDMIETVNGVHV